MYQIKGYNGAYSIDENGNVFSHERTINAGYGAKRKIKAKILKHKIDSKGYPTVTLYKGGKRQFKHHRVHRLIMENIFPIENMENIDINHKDGDKSNNSIDNLEWATRSMNIKHAHDNGLNKSSSSFKQKKAASTTCLKLRKLTFEQAQEIRSLYKIGNSQSKLGALYDVNRATIGLIVNNKTYLHNGSKYDV